MTIAPLYAKNARMPSTIAVPILALSVSLLATSVPSAAQLDNSATRIRAVETGLNSSPVEIEGLKESTSTLESQISERKIPGLSIAVINGGKLAWAKGYGVADLSTKAPVTTETQFSAGSITKFITAVAVMRLVQAKQLDLDADVNDSLVKWKVSGPKLTRQHPVTLRYLLSHTSGVEGHFPSRYAVDSKAPSALEVLARGSDSGQYKVIQEPGTHFLYSSSAFLVIQELMEERLGKPFVQIANEQVLGPAHMAHSSFDLSNANHFERATGYIVEKGGRLVERRVAFADVAGSGMWTTPTDLAILVLNLQSSGKPGSLLDKLTYETMLKPVLTNAGLGVFLAGEEEELRFRVRGSDGYPNDEYVSWLTAYAHRGQAAIVMANSPTSTTTGFALLRSIAAAYKWPGYFLHRTMSNVDASVYSRYVGTYDLEMTGPVEIRTDGKQLFGYAGPLKILLQPLSENTFFVNDNFFSEAQVRFEIDSHGNAVKLYWEYPSRHESHVAVKIK